MNLGMKEVSFVPPPQSTVILRGKSYFVEDTVFLLDYDRCELIVHEQEKRWDYDWSDFEIVQ